MGYFKEKQKVSNFDGEMHKTFEVPLTFYSNLINLCYCTLSTPFGISRKGGMFQPRSNVFNKIVCGSLNVLCIIQGVLLTRGSYTLSIIENPQMIFKVWSRIHIGLLVAAWTHSFWFKQPQILLLINSVKTSNSSCKITSYSLMVAGFCLMSHIGYFVVVMLFGQGGDRAAGLRYTSAHTLYDIFITKNVTLIPQDEQLSYSIVAITIIYTLIRVYGMIIIGFVCSFSFLSALVAYRGVAFISQLCDILDSGHSTITRQEIVDEYGKLGLLLEKVNEVNRPFLLLLCSASVPVFVGRLIGAWDTAKWEFRFFVICKIFTFLGPFFLAAEVYHKAKGLKTRLLELNHCDLDGISSAKIRRDDFGLEGGRFFKVSYGFLGSVASVYLSYAIMLLQMQPSGNC